MTIRLSDEVEKRLRDAASRRGIDIETYVTNLITSHVVPGASAKSVIELFDEWEAQEGTADPTELERRRLELEQFKDAMNQNRLDTEGPGARKVYP